jgi:hypothetical protein
MAFFGMLLAFTLTRPGAVGAQGVDRAVIVQQWIDARNRYDVDAVMALLTDTAVAAHGRQCLLPTPCVGEANRPVFTGDAPAQAQHTIINMQGYGAAIVGQIEVRSNAIRAADVERVVSTFLIQIPQDKISAYIGIPDVTDPQTARFVAAQQAPR